MNLKAGGTKSWNQARYSARLSKTNLKFLDTAYTARQYMAIQIKFKYDCSIRRNQMQDKRRS